MSELLQQAIIDATALKEAAIKNAENTLIEKYSQEFKDTVQRLLEQEQAAPVADATAAAPAAMAASPVPDVSATTEPQADLSAEPQQDGGSAFDSVPSSFLDGDENEMITINFDQIKSTMMEMLGHTESLEEVDITSAHETTGMDAVAPGAPNKSKNELEEEFELELEGWEEMEEETSSGGAVEAVEALEEVDLGEGAAVQAATANLTGVKAKMGKEEAAAQQKLQAAQDQEAKAEAEAEKSVAVAEEIAITEEELMELAERLAVDIKVGSMGRGYMGSTATETKLQREAELAAARDDKAVAQREEEMKKMGDLVKENTELKATSSKLVETLEMLKEQLEKINVSNAKLLYTNKALGNISLNERQKSQIVESISKADSVLAAKTIYETLQNAVESTKKEKTVPQSLHEAINRAQSPFVVKKSSANSINDVMAERMKALAGIKHTK
jgi:hypothetical protein